MRPQDPDLPLVLKRQRDRYVMLRTLWRESKGDYRRFERDLVKVLVDDGMEREAAILAYQYLVREGLIKISGSGHSASITHEGVKEIEDSIQHPDRDTEHFVFQVIQNTFNGPVAAVQTGPSSSANVSQEDGEPDA